MLYLNKNYIMPVCILNCLIVIMVDCMLFGKMLFAKHINHTEILIFSKINYENGYYSYRLRYPCAPDGDEPSNLVLYENGVRLGPAHSAHSRIRKKGKGKYSHWKSNLLYFSTSDNSDPRSNGRKYKVTTIHDIVTQEEVITANFYQYQVNVGGKKEPFNRYIKMENIGDSNIIVNPKVISDNIVDMSSVQSIVSGVFSDSMGNKEKAIKLWEFVRDNRYCWSPAEKIHELCDPIEYFNVYGFGFCSAAAEAL